MQLSQINLFLIFSCISTMASLRDLIKAAIKSLLKGPSFFHAFLAFWTSLSTPSPSNPREAAQPPRKNDPESIAKFLAEVESLLLEPTKPDRLRGLSRGLKHEFREALLSNPACMLPSYHTELPTGNETGQYLAVDVGGSTLRVALVTLKGRNPSTGCPESHIVSMDTFDIDNAIRNLKGIAFFDWMADKINQTVTAQDPKIGRSPENPLSLALSWSFPIEQPTPSTFLLLPMGKSFHAADGLIGQNLSSILTQSSLPYSLHLSLSVVVNDSTSTLLSAAYSHPTTTTLALILGTGVNISAHLPLATISTEKHPPSITATNSSSSATHVIVNTELGMFHPLPSPSGLTRWDLALRHNHPRPDFQPLEHLVSGLYLGEICRWVLLEAIKKVGLFGGVIPPSLKTHYSLDTKALSLLQADSSPTLTPSLSLFHTLHPSPIPATPTDLQFLRSVASFVTQRSASIVAASLHALHEIDVEDSPYHQSPPPEIIKTIAYAGSVVEHYPNYLSNLQSYLDQLSLNTPTHFKLVPAKESSVLGAAVALACLDT
ncbi:putative hexokinase [Triangularia verruculosa]|uniref:Phosphotransferase n=1 Tax=Triangularia verruculosa TaxID=2587418 RepID=A0AAN7AR40_9PEZI|nr:putative hexokinase [Triangularia verruculosa]